MTMAKQNKKKFSKTENKQKVNLTHALEYRNETKAFNFLSSLNQMGFIAGATIGEINMKNMKLKRHIKFYIILQISAF